MIQEKVKKALINHEWCHLEIILQRRKSNMAPLNKGLNDSEKKLVDFINAGELESTRFFGKVALIFWAFFKINKCTCF